MPRTSRLPYPEGVFRHATGRCFCVVKPDLNRRPAGVLDSGPSILSLPLYQLSYGHTGAILPWGFVISNYFMVVEQGP